MFEINACELFAEPSEAASNAPALPPGLCLSEYQEVIVLFSGGKDSLACLLHLLEIGVPREKIELHYHPVDGKEGSTLMDWPVTASYCRKIADHFGLRFTESWRVGGFEREMLRENAQTAPVSIPMPGGVQLVVGGERSKPSTRRKFPQLSPSLLVRWCSSSAKISCGDRYFTTNPRFQDGLKRLVVSGERAEESANRATYAVFEPNRVDNRGGKRVNRHLDHYRAVHAWTEKMVWDVISRWAVNPHPAYWLGLGRASCRNCIYGSKAQWATMRFIDRDGFDVVANYEQEFGVTIHRNMSVNELADRGSILPGAHTKWASIAMSTEFTEPIIVADWKLPPGAFGESCGPS